ncbi:hypothetical protein J1N35_019394 [Gossypium stocksii]|uniref:Cullin N-terminal domain-containing protein n=1 Tax=Gossypium stocksii TaxID=47602 RepID=A0A9D4A5V0_9ROSI|nr:hypothetical protein J1N35_019394 [Gossypium stocksii]
MSAQKKKAFQIEAFKHRVVVDPKYAEKTWKILEHAIHEIYNHNASGLSFEELYRSMTLANGLRFCESHGSLLLVLGKFLEFLSSAILTFLAALRSAIELSLISAKF